MLLTASITEFIQIREIKIDPTTQKKSLEVVRSCHSEGESEEISFASPYFLLSNFKLKRNVF